MKSIDNINQLNKSDFLSIFGNVFEKTEWITEKVFELKPFKNFNDLSSKILEQYENCNKENIIKILNSHPELAVAKKLTDESKLEQAGANLNECTVDEFNEFKNLNFQYKNKFGFPFIIAVKGKNKTEILNNFRQRILNNIEIEFEEAKKQVKKIATFRLNEILNQ
tara:strand:- start:4536 stop:5033 length:498 start_codon:yes stop_codon:yes gene_type:complete